MQIKFSLVHDLSHLKSRLEVSGINLELRAESIREKDMLKMLAAQAHEVQLVAIASGKAGTGNAVGTSSSGRGVDSMSIAVHLGGSNLSEARDRIKGLLEEAIRLNDIDQ